MTFWMMWRLPLKIYFIIFCNSSVYLNAHSNDSTSNEQWNFGDTPPLRRHYETIFNLLKKSIVGEKLIRLEDKKLPVQVLACVPGHRTIFATFSIHERSKITYRVCSDEINAAAIIDIKNAMNRLSQFNKLFSTLYSEKSPEEESTLEFLNGHTHEIKVGMYIIDDCNDENLARYFLELMKNWSHFNESKAQNPCLLSASTQEQSFPTLGTFSSFPKRSSNSTFAEMNFINVDLQATVQNFSFNTFEDSYIICSILRHFGWTRTGLIYDIEFDGYRFTKIAEFFNICVSRWELKRFDDNATNLNEYYEDLINLLEYEEDLNVYVIFCNRPHVFKELMDMIEKSLTINNNIFVISGDMKPQDREWMRNSTFLVYHTEEKKVDSIDDGKLKFIRECLMTNEISNSTLEDCWPSESECNFPENEFSFVQKNTSKSEFADLHVMSDKKCRRSSISKLDEIFYYYLGVHAFLGFAQNVIFEKLHMQLIADNTWLTLLYTINLSIEPRNISIGNGTWDASRRRIIFETLPDETQYLSKFSSCSNSTRLCKSGQREKKVLTNERCCLECEDCNSNQISIWNECHTCKIEEWPNKNRTECVPMKKRPLQWDDPEIVICVAYSTITVIMVVTTLCIFIKNQNTPVVKSSTRELSYMMLVSMIAVESTIFIFMSRREDPLCSLIQIVPLLSFCIIYTGLLVKTVRIARLLALSRNKFPPRNMKCMSTKSQVVIMINFIIVELVISVLMLYLARPLQSKNRNYNDPQGRVAPMLTPICEYNLNIFLSNFSVVFILVVLCTGCAVWVRKVPDNFNEAKYIGFCMYATCLTWIAFGFTVAGAEHNYEILALCTCFSTNNLLTLIFLFFPKLYIIIFKPQKNVRKYFRTTSESIRVHMKNSRKRDILLKNLDGSKN